MELEKYQINAVATGLIRIHITQEHKNTFGEQEDVLSSEHSAVFKTCRRKEQNELGVLSDYWNKNQQLKIRTVPVETDTNNQLKPCVLVSDGADDGWIPRCRRCREPGELWAWSPGTSSPDSQGRDPACSWPGVPVAA